MITPLYGQLSPLKLGGSLPVPKRISGLQLWLDAADSSTLFNATAGGSLVTNDGAAVARWADKSGNNRHATQATANARPILKTAVKNGRNVLRFDGANDTIMGNWNLTLTQQTVFAVFSSSYTSGATSSQFARIFTQSDSNKDYLAANNYVPLVRNSGNNISSWTTSGSWASPVTYASGTYAAACSLHSGSSITNFINGVTGTAQSSPTLNKTFTRFAIGLALSDELEAVNGDILEILIYNTALTTTQRQAVEAYLNSKWALY